MKFTSSNYPYLARILFLVFDGDVFPKDCNPCCLTDNEMEVTEAFCKANEEFFEKHEGVPFPEDSKK